MSRGVHRHGVSRAVFFFSLYCVLHFTGESAFTVIKFSDFFVAAGALLCVSGVRQHFCRSPLVVIGFFALLQKQGKLFLPVFPAAAAWRVFWFIADVELVNRSQNCLVLARA